MAIARIRTINEAYEYILSEDKNTSITRNWIREMCKTKEISSFKVGSRVLLNLDELLKKIENNFQ